MSQRPHHARTGSQGGRKLLPAHARPSKPPPLTKRGNSCNGLVHSQNQPQCHTPTKSSSAWSRKIAADEEARHVEDEESGMASFLQFCATCEKQIITPGASILYCSESCRQRDVSRPTSIQSIEAIKSPSAAAAISAHSLFDHPPDIVPQMSPTVLRPMSMTFSDLSLTDSHSSHSSSEEAEERRDSAATHYLEQFYSSFASAHESNNRRSNFNRASTATDVSTIPSLIHSPSSSYGTVASNASYRPLVPRHNPFTPAFNSKSIDVVIPYPTASDSSPTQPLKDASLKSSASTSTQFRVVEAEDLSYEKRSPRSGRGSDKRADHTLRRLFSHDATRASPSAN